jgi:hypothetical protein
MKTLSHENRVFNINPIDRRFYFILPEGRRNKKRKHKKIVAIGFQQTPGEVIPKLNKDFT